MPKHYESCSAKCPYYKCEERHEIYCTGPKDATAIHMAFAVPTEKKLWMKAYCKSGYASCLIYKALVELGK